MNILWVKAGGFLPLDSGGKIRSYNIVRELARSHTVTVFTFYPEHEADANPELRGIVDRAICYPIRMPLARSFLELLRYGARFGSSLPFAFLKYCRPEVSAAIRKLVVSSGFDAIVCDFLLSAGVLPWDTVTPKILFTHNVEALIWRRHYDNATNPLWKAVYWREWRATARLEAKYIRLSDHVLTVSEFDRQVFATQIPLEQITTIPTGVDLDFFRTRGHQRIAHSLVFTGSMDWMPNEDGILFFLQQVFPSIQIAVPEVTLKIVGRKPSLKLQDTVRRYSNVALTGWVDDIRSYLDEAEVCIVPLRVGSGTRLKIFEAMAMGKAIVSTSLGAEGLPVTDGENILIEDVPGQFASSVIKLLNDLGLRRSLEVAARSLVEKQYSWQSVANHFVNLLERVVSHHTEVATF
jgi:glycosyltransferase involved in cell wall biosynthesis